MLRDELRDVWGWSDVSREGWKQVKGGQAACDDVVGRPPGFGSMIAFENKFYATGFDKYYTLVPVGVERVCFFIPETDEAFVVTLNPNKAIEAATHISIENFDKKARKAMLSLAKKCRDWAGNAQILSLKQNGLPFLYVRYRK